MSPAARWMRTLSAVTDSRRAEKSSNSSALSRSLPAGHTEGWLESMGNLYRSFMECLHAKKDGTFEPGMIDFPTVHDGAEGVRFVQACLQSNEKGNAWVTMDENA